MLYPFLWRAKCRKRSRVVSTGLLIEYPPLGVANGFECRPSAFPCSCKPRQQICSMDCESRRIPGRLDPTVSCPSQHSFLTNTLDCPAPSRTCTYQVLSLWHHLQGIGQAIPQAGKARAAVRSHCAKSAGSQLWSRRMDLHMWSRSLRLFAASLASHG